jgi:hypothetical protein
MDDGMGSFAFSSMVSTKEKRDSNLNGVKKR